MPNRLTGWGLGLREEHIADILNSSPSSLPVSWFEIISENYLNVGGKKRQQLEMVRAGYPMAMHGVSLSLGSLCPISEDYLKSLKELATFLEPVYLSDHLSWTRWQNQSTFDLLPLPYTVATLKHLCARIHYVQDYLGRRLYIENPSAYIAFQHQEYAEGEFLAELVRRTGCGLILDVNNLYVNQHNLGFNAIETLLRLNPDSIGYIHVAGHAIHPDLPDVRVDTHGTAVAPAVIELLRTANHLLGTKPTMIERDDNIPSLDVLLEEVQQIAICSPQVSSKSVATLLTPYNAESYDREPIISIQENLFKCVKGAPLNLQLAYSGQTAPETGIRVYRDAYHARLFQALRGTFPCLAQIIGDMKFRRIASEYLAVTNLNQYDIRQVGSELSSFLRERNPAVLTSCSNLLLADIALIEWGQAEICDAADFKGGESLPVSFLAQLPVEKLPDVTLNFVAHWIATLKYPAYVITEAFAENAELPPPPPPAAEGDLILLYVRDGSSSRICRYEIGIAEQRLINELAQGSALMQAAIHAEVDETFLAATLVKIFNWGLVCEVNR